MDYFNDSLEQQYVSMMSFHPANSEKSQPERYAELRQHFIHMSRIVNQMCPDGRAKDLALTHLEEALMRSTQAIAVGEDD